MRHVLVITNRRIKKENIVSERIVSEDEAREAFDLETKREVADGWIAVVLYQEFDSIQEVPADALNGCRLFDNDGKRTIRRCRVSQGW